MPALTPDTIHTATETLSELTDYLRENPDPVEALAFVEPLLDEYTGLPVQLADTLRALARTLQEHPDTPRTAQVDLLIAELRTAAWEQADQHTLHYVLDDLRDLYGSTAASEPGDARCPLSERQLAAFADKHARQIPFDTSPRHLAGPGDARHVTHGLAAAGWSPVSDPLSAEIVLRSPDLRHRLQFDPQSTTSAWWRLRAEPADTEPGWYAEFGELVPAEVLAGFTDALVAPPPQQPDPWQAVPSAGWHRDSGGTAYSPDSMCHIELRPLSEFSDRPSWHVETREPGYDQFPGPRIWHAYLDERTPAHLVGSFLTALVDRSPLQRGMYDRTGHYSTVQEPSPLRPQQVVDAHTARIESLRARARSTRRQLTRPAPTPAKAHTAQPAARR